MLTTLPDLADRYVIRREIGRGGMATVYLADDIRHDRPVAIKVLHPELLVSIGVERFAREIRTVARLQHPHILPLFDSGGAEGSLFFVMPFVDGENIMLVGDNALLADFGIARAHGVGLETLTSMGMPRGTPAYMSPDQVSGDTAIDGRSRTRHSVPANRDNE